MSSTTKRQKQSEGSRPGGPHIVGSERGESRYDDSPVYRQAAARLGQFAVGPERSGGSLPALAAGRSAVTSVTLASQTRAEAGEALFRGGSPRICCGRRLHR